MNASLARTAVVTAADASSPVRATPAPHVYRQTWRGAVVLADVAGLALAFGTAVAVVWRVSSTRPSLGAAVVAAMLVLLAFSANALHEKSFAIARRDEFYYALAVCALCAAAIVPAFFVTDMSWGSRIAVALGVAISGITIGALRYLLRGAVNEEVLFVQPHVRVVKPPTGAIEPWLDQICSTGTPTHLVIDEPNATLSANALARAAARRGIVLAVAAESCAPALAVRGLAIGGATLLELDVPRIVAPWARRAKRLFDIVVATAALAVAAPFLALAALAILLEDRGPILYTQPRMGRDGKPFPILKLRSMRMDAEAHTGPVWAVNGDARITRIGRILRRTSIDELPQLVNVLRGEMSIVGPRPERPVFVEAFCAKLPQYAERLIVAPGLTACSHLYMPRIVGSDAVEERLAYDLFYLRHWSPVMDVALILKTATEVVFHRAA